MNPEFDIAVIGAGPAGSTFARLAASGGKRILLIDGQDIYTKKPCGGLLAPDAQKVLAHFGSAKECAGGSADFFR